MEKLIAINDAHPQHTKKVTGASSVAPSMLRAFGLTFSYTVSPGIRNFSDAHGRSLWTGWENAPFSVSVSKKEHRL
ncbi:MULTISPECIES: hypothetical protein [Paraburkholderia]|uniref:hypothetical protein n=1 Tax=Paraburkholderia TaxID=1822464 RepID=UPI0016563B13|nr:hypothetical protein [Paraburkholderia podalyriae]